MRSLISCLFTLMTLIGATAFASAQSSGVVGNEYEANEVGTCLGNSCVVNFPINNLTYPVKIYQVSCQSQSEQILLMAQADVNGGAQRKRKWLIPGNPVRWSSTTLYTTINDETALVVGPGRYLSVRTIGVDPNGHAWQLECRVSGEVLK